MFAPFVSLRGKLFDRVKKDRCIFFEFSHLKEIWQDYETAYERKEAHIMMV